ncbi:coiled-coil domain-containing protein 190 [Carcharodon carcharias]|uniref:coiled-coil domain-containing protein 190 n=1 Tax=Carcharodon carcharias TaxID=13397 RepID=UPI001B7F46C9|nr:coiled-coil domain-containing protein 190 [Carcharodon carcharias]
MQRSKSHIFEGDIKRFEAERRQSKRAEVRLQNGLHDLEEARFYCIDRMIKEQRRIQRDLIRINNGYSKKVAVDNFRLLYPDNSTSARGKSGSSKIILPTIPGVKDHAVILESGRSRTQSCYFTKAGKIGMPSSASLALQIQINDFLNGFSTKQGKSNGHTEAEETKPSTPSSKLKTPSINSINMSGLKHCIAKHVSIPEKPTGLDVANGRESQAADGQMEQDASDAEANSNVSSDQAQRQIKSRESTSSPQLSACQESTPYDSEFYAPDGLPRTMHTMPSFLEAFAEAKKARYIRHRTKTDDEKELTISEIFGKRRERVQDIVVKEVETSNEKYFTGKNTV